MKINKYCGIFFAAIALMGITNAAVTEWFSDTFESYDVGQDILTASAGFSTTDATTTGVVAGDAANKFVEFNAPAAPLKYTPSTAHDDNAKVFLDAEVKIVATTAPTSYGISDVQTEVCFVYQDSASNACDLYAHVGSVDGNVWVKLTNASVSLANGDWARVKIVVDYSKEVPEFQYIIVKDSVDYVLADESASDVFHVMARTTSTEKKVSSVMFLGSGSIDNFAGSYEAVATSPITIRNQYEDGVESSDFAASGSFTEAGDLALTVADSTASGKALKYVRILKQNGDVLAVHRVDNDSPVDGNYTITIGSGVVGTETQLIVDGYYGDTSTYSNIPELYIPTAASVQVGDRVFKAGAVETKQDGSKEYVMTVSNPVSGVYYALKVGDVVGAHVLAMPGDTYVQVRATIDTTNKNSSTVKFVKIHACDGEDK